MSQVVLAPAAQHYRDVFEQARTELSGSAVHRSAALARFVELGFPGAREEAWKYTNLRRLESRRFAPAHAASEVALQSLPASFTGRRIVVENGRIRADARASNVAESAGFRLTTLASAAGDDRVSEAVLRVLAGGGTERFAALNAALAPQFVFSFQPAEMVMKQMAADVLVEVADPDRQCVAFVGDGGFTMLMGEFATAVKYELPFTVVVIKNNTLGMIKWEQMVFLGNFEYGGGVNEGG